MPITRGNWSGSTARPGASGCAVKALVSRLLTKLEAGNRVQVALLVQDAGPPAP